MQTNDEIIRKTDNRVEYLEEQIREYTQMCEGLEDFCKKNETGMSECKKAIDELQEKEDAGFALFSPIAVDSEKKEEVLQLKAQQEMLGKQNEKYQKDILFYRGKIQEMQGQLDYYLAQQRGNKIGTIPAHTEEQTLNMLMQLSGEESAEKLELAAATETDATTEIQTWKKDLAVRLRTIHNRMDGMNNMLYVDLVRCNVEINKMKMDLMKIIEELE